MLAAQTSATFHISSRLIQVSVIVHDRKGEPVTGLDIEGAVRLAIDDSRGSYVLAYYPDLGRDRVGEDSAQARLFLN